MPRQSAVFSISCLIRFWPRVKTGSKISMTFFEACWTDLAANISVMKEYSADMLSRRARLKFLKGTSRPCMDLSSSARYDDIAIGVFDFRTSARRPIVNGSCAEFGLREPGMPCAFRLG